MTRYKNFCFSAVVFFIMLMFAFNAKHYAEITFDGITLWAFTIVPSVFFYFVLTSILIMSGSFSSVFLKSEKTTRKLFGCGGFSAYALFMSLLSGYPTGAKITADLYENKLISHSEAVKISGLSSTSSILFIVSTIGSMTDLKSAVFIAISHILSVLITAIILKGRKKTCDNFNKTTIVPEKILSAKRNDNIIFSSVYESILSVLMLGGIIVVYYVLANMLFTVGILYLPEKLVNLTLHDQFTAHALIGSLFESISGIKLLSMSDHFLKIPLIGFSLSFGGLSVITQSVIHLKRAKIKTAPFIFSKIIQAVLCFLILFLFSLLKVF